MHKSQPLISITRRHALIFAVFLVLYEFLTYISNDMIMPGMLQVVKSFNAPETAVARSLMLYILGGSTLQIILGPLSDHYGRRPVMIAGGWVFLVFTILLACSGSINQFLAGRFFQGMGLCFITVVGYATIQEIFEEMEVVRLMAIMANVSILAPLLGPLLGALFVMHWNWRLIFVVIAVLALFTLWGLWRFMPESVGETKRDGEVIPRADLSPREIGGRYKALFKNPKFMLASVGAGLLGLPCVAWIGLAPVIIVSASGESLVQYGVWQIPVFLAAILGNVTLHRLTRHFELKQLIMIGSSTVGMGLFLMPILVFLFGKNFIWLMPGLVIYFFGIGLTGAPLARFTLYATKITKGTASALMGLVLMISQAVGIELINDLYVSHNNWVFAVCCAGVGIIYMMVMGGIFLLVKRERDNRPA
ncbi:MAG: MFS transporter [Gammaproteobacteria bacterium]|nr:MFS transporter [Gammaproteobacteria bacterium]